MNINRYEYKAHKLVKLFFHLIFFGIGLVVGLGIKELKLNNFLNIFFDNVSAYTIDTYNGLEFNEDFIRKSFEGHYAKDLFDFDDDVYVWCFAGRFNNNSDIWKCFLYPKTMIPRYEYSYYSSYDGVHLGVTSVNILNAILYFEYSKSKGTYYYSAIYGGTSNGYAVGGGVTNFDNLTHLNSNLTGDFSSLNHLEFKKEIKLEYNENLFADNPNYKKVCVNNYDSFSITTKNIKTYLSEDSPIYSGFDFIWFNDNVTGLKNKMYDSSSETHIKDNSDYKPFIGGEYIYFNSLDAFNSDFDGVNVSAIFRDDDNYNLYDIYGYSAYTFELHFTNDYYYYPIFYFENYKKTFSLDNVTGGGAGSPFSVEENDFVSEPICFYIKNEFDVNILNKNEWGDYYSDITILGDKVLSDSTSYNEDNIDQQGYFSIVTSFVSKISHSISFINDYIYKTYLSMPTLLRMFIISFIVISFIKLIIDMLTR